MIPGRGRFLAAWVRTFAVQGSWNYRTLIGGGMAYALAPLLERIHAGDPVALRKSLERAATEFNSHPYLSPIAVGALARLEYDRQDEETLRRFRGALQAPLGAMGDQVLWAGWRPFCVLVSGLLFLMGVGPVLTAAMFLLVYNAGHVAVRVWGFRLGWARGLEVGAALKAVPTKRVSRAFVFVNQVLMGAVAALLIARISGLEQGGWIGPSAAAAGLVGYFVPRGVAGLAIAALFVACLL